MPATTWLSLGSDSDEETVPTKPCVLDGLLTNLGCNSTNSELLKSLLIQTFQVKENGTRVQEMYDVTSVTLGQWGKPAQCDTTTVPSAFWRRASHCSPHFLPALQQGPNAGFILDKYVWNK
jgi:hypothetical protein